MEEGARGHFFYHVKGEIHATRNGKWKLMLPDRTQVYEYAGDPKVDAPELLEQENDIGEQHNVAATSAGSPDPGEPSAQTCPISRSLPGRIHLGVHMVKYGKRPRGRFLLLDRSEFSDTALGQLDIVVSTQHEVCCPFCLGMEMESLFKDTKSRK